MGPVGWVLGVSLVDTLWGLSSIFTVGEEIITYYISEKQ